MTLTAKMRAWLRWNSRPRNQLLRDFILRFQREFNLSDPTVAGRLIGEFLRTES